MAKDVIDRELLINACWSYRGRVSLIAAHFKVTSQTIYNYRDKYKTVATALKDAKRQGELLLVDTAETKLEQAVLSGHRWAITHVLNRSKEAKTRGWGTRLELTGEGGQDLIPVLTREEKERRVRAAMKEYSDEPPALRSNPD